MLTRESIRTVRTVIAPQRQPVLSLYLDVNPANHDNVGGAPFIRAKDELKRLGLDKGVADAVLAKLKDRLVMPKARTLVVFAGEDADTFFVAYPLQLPFPQLEGRGVVGRWGRPYVTPLLQLIDSQERIGVVYLDQARWRYFEVFFGEIAELRDAFRPLDTSHWRYLGEAKQGVAQGVPARGGSGVDRFERRKGAWTQRFFKQAVSVLDHAVRTSEVDWLIMMGPADAVSEFRALLPHDLGEMVADCLPPPANPDAGASDIVALIEPCIARLRKDQEASRLDEIAEQGVWGTEATLEALQEGRLRLIVAPWHSDLTVYYCSERGYAAASLSAAARHCPDQHHEPELLQELLPELATGYGAALTYLQGEAEQRLDTEYGGLAGLRRW